MKTIQFYIRDYVELLPANFIDPQDVPKIRDLVRELYDHTLQDDPDFHFFFEPETFVRTSSEESLSRVKSFLNDKEIGSVEEDYPFAPPGELARYLRIFPRDSRKPRDSLVELYAHALDDPGFALIYEPVVVIRLSSEKCRNKVKSFLKKREPEEYDYPSAPPDRFGEDDRVAKKLDLFLPVFHAHSVAAITLDEDDHLHYLERVIHTAFVPRSYSDEGEAKELLKQGALRFGKQGIQITLEVPARDPSGKQRINLKISLLQRGA